MLRLLATLAIITPLAAHAEPVPTEEQVIIERTADEPTTLDLLVDDIVVDCSTIYGCSVGHQVLSW